VREAPARFDLVLLDLRMPGLTGETTFAALRELAPRLKILIWSGFAAEQDVAGMLGRGAAGFVQKPYRVAELSRTIAAALRK
jgi:DNA-binding NarL/FixJ family response regulator